ncbi:MAG TPA: HdeD family acid-resistance protein [Ktedonobacteraceae bacterium]|nr:HdeD family acid-resistance protein [Ktedonobacteraceae bacterium]
MISPATQPTRYNWWLMLLRGIVAIILGLIVLFDPGIALLAIIYVFGAYALIDGILSVIVAIAERRYLPRWGWLVVEGVAGIILGIIAFAWPGETALILLYVVAIWAVVTGVMEIAAAFTVGSWLLGLTGVLSIVFGIILFVHPGAGLLSILWLLGVYGIVFGIVLIVHAFQLHSQPSSPLNRLGGMRSRQI